MPVASGQTEHQENGSHCLRKRKCIKEGGEDGRGNDRRRQALADLPHQWIVKPASPSESAERRGRIKSQQSRKADDPQFDQDLKILVIQDPVFGQERAKSAPKPGAAAEEDVDKGIAVGA